MRWRVTVEIGGWLVVRRFPCCIVVGDVAVQGEGEGPGDVSVVFDLLKLSFGPMVDFAPHILREPCPRALVVSSECVQSRSERGIELELEPVHHGNAIERLRVLSNIRETLHVGMFTHHGSSCDLRDNAVIAPHPVSVVKQQVTAVVPSGAVIRASRVHPDADQVILRVRGILRHPVCEVDVERVLKLRVVSDGAGGSVASRHTHDIRLRRNADPMPHLFAIV